jgi:hypothetical protein
MRKIVIIGQFKTFDGDTHFMSRSAEIPAAIGGFMGVLVPTLLIDMTGREN